MDKVSLNMLSKGAKFFIENFSVDKLQKIKLMELGILPKIQMQILQTNLFGSTIVKCNGMRYAIDNAIAQKLFTSKNAS